MVRILCMGRKLLINEIPQNRKKNERIYNPKTQLHARRLQILRTVEYNTI